MTRKYLSPPAIELVRRLAQEEVRTFTVQQAARYAHSVGISPGYLRQALHHLARSGWIVRLRKGLYALAGTVPGVTPLHEFEIAMALVRPGAISHWSALSYHGMSERVPRRVFVLTSARTVPRSRARRGGAVEGYPVVTAIYQFVQVKPERFFGTEEAWVHESRVHMTDPERTLLDCLCMPQYCGGFAEVLHAFDVRGPNIDVERIVDYALKLDAATVKRLGWILERLGIEHARLERLRQLSIKGYRILDPTGARRGRCDSGWMIQVNAPAAGRA